MTIVMEEGHRPIRLLALVSKRMGLSPGQRFRLEQWAPRLAADHGIELDFLPFESDELTEVLYQPGHRLRKAGLIVRDGFKRFGVLSSARRYDGVVVYREATLLGGSYLEWMLRRLAGLPLILDFDDAIWQTAVSPRNGIMSLVRAPWKTSALCRIASAVTVGNEFLAAWSRQYSKEVHIVRTSIDLDAFEMQPAPPDSPFTIAWTGSHSTLQHLERLRDVFAAVGAAVPTRIRIVCDERPPDFANVENDFVRWSPTTEATALHAAHVGVMPLPDTPAARGKCGCKALQYMAIGRPAVVAPVGINREIIRDGENGLWATSEREWIDALLRLARNPEERARMGRAGRATVEDGFSSDSAAAAFAAVVRRVIRADSVAVAR